MKKIGLLLPLLGLVFASAVYAYSGTHNFLLVNTTTSNGHSYRSEYLAKGTFNFNGSGIQDRSKVNLKGTLNVSEIDGTPVGISYCVTLKGTLGTTSGKLTATQYANSDCSSELSRKVYTITQFSEDSLGNFLVVAKDETGNISTTSGVHQYSR